MRLLPLLLLLPAAAIAQDAPPRPMGNGAPPAALSGGLPPLPQAPRAVIGRLFISPAGEPFRAPVDAPYPLATWFAGADHNHDGKIDLTEMTWDFDRFFDSIDTDHDGTLRNDEIERYERMVPELHSGGFAGGNFGGGGGRGKGGGGRHRGGGGGGHGGGGMGGGMGGTGGGFGGVGGAGGYHGDDAGAGSGAAQGGQDEQSSDDSNHAPPAYVPTGSATRYELISIPEPVAAMDTDLSGTVTRLELHRAAARRFAILDVKQRGYLMLADLPEPDAERHINPQRRR